MNEGNCLVAQIQMQYALQKLIVLKNINDNDYLISIGMIVDKNDSDKIDYNGIIDDMLFTGEPTIQHQYVIFTTKSGNLIFDNRIKTNNLIDIWNEFKHLYRIIPKAVQIDFNENDLSKWDEFQRWNTNTSLSYKTFYSKLQQVISELNQPKENDELMEQEDSLFYIYKKIIKNTSSYQYLP